MVPFRSRVPRERVVFAPDDKEVGDAALQQGIAIIGKYDL